MRGLYVSEEKVPSAKKRNECVKMRRTVLGDKKNSIDGQSSNLDIERGDVVQKPLLPLGGVCYTVLPLPPSLRFLDIKIRWQKQSQHSLVGCVMRIRC